MYFFSFRANRTVQLRVIPLYGFAATEAGVEQMLLCSLYQKVRRTSGVIKLPILGEIKQCKSMVFLRDFPYNNVLFGLLI